MVIGVFALLAGCDGDDPSLSTPTEQTAAKKSTKKHRKPQPIVDSLAPTSVIARVNGEDITQGEFKTWEKARTGAWAMARGWKPNIDNEETKKFRANGRMRALGELVKHKLIGQYAVKEGITVTEEGLSRQKSSFLQSINKRKSDFDKVIASFGKSEGESLREIIRGDALTMAVLEHSTSNNLNTVTEEEYTNRIEFVRQWNARADMTNAAVRARAAQAKAEILGGAYFADVAKKYADFLPEQGVAWDTFYLDEFDGDNPLGQWLARSDTGDISDPIDLEDGISIVGLKMKYISPLSESNKPPVYAYEVVRCPFYAYERIDDLGEDRKLVLDDIIEKRREFAMKELHDKLVENASIEFPCGNNLFYPPQKAKKKAKKAVKGEKAKAKKNSKSQTKTENTKEKSSENS